MLYLFKFILRVLCLVFFVLRLLTYFIRLKLTILFAFVYFHQYFAFSGLEVLPLQLVFCPLCPDIFVSILFILKFPFVSVIFILVCIEISFQDGFKALSNLTAASESYFPTFKDYFYF